MNEKITRLPVSPFGSIAILLFELAIFIPLALGRLVARDEGFYTYASRLVLEGATPYIDFFYPQMPLLPYVYGGWFAIFGSTWESARIFSALLCALIGLLVFHAVNNRHGTNFGLLALFLFVTSNFVFPWHLTVQTYALSTLLLFGACHLTSLGVHKKHLYFIAGILFGLSVLSRLFFIGVLPAFLLYLYLERKSFLQASLLFLCGLALAVSPLLYFALADYDLFYFNNLGYHLTRAPISPEQSFDNKLRVASVLLGFKNSVKFAALQFPLLLWGTIITGLWCALNRIKAPLSIFIALILLAINFTPTPTYVQYSSTLVPFLIVTVVFLFSKLLDNSKTPRVRKIIGAALSLFILGYLSYLPSDILRYTKTGDGVIGIRTIEKAQSWNLNTLNQISTFIDSETDSGDQVATLWPGYLFATKASTLPRAENHFGFDTARTLTPEKQKWAKVMSNTEWASMIVKTKPKLVILPTGRKRRIRETVQTAGYDKINSIGEVSFYTLPH